MIIRLMNDDDVDVARSLDALAFLQYSRQTGRGDTVALRTRENVLACLHLNPDGCFIAESGRGVGLIFSRRWGTVGWVGTFGVHPDWQGQGIGRRLLTEAVSHLKASGCTIIGLETMPDSPYNLGFYTGFGFRPIFPTLILEKKVPETVEGSALVSFHRAPGEIGFATVTQISQSVLSGLDYAPEAKSAVEHGWGETLLIGQPEPWSTAIVRTVPKREGSVQSTAEVSALAVQPESRPQLAMAIRALEAFVCERGLQRVRLATNSADWEALRHLRGLGFKVVRLSQRMVLHGQDYCPTGVDLSPWAM